MMNVYTYFGTVKRQRKYAFIARYALEFESFYYIEKAHTLSGLRFHGDDIKIAQSITVFFEIQQRDLQESQCKTALLYFFLCG